MTHLSYMMLAVLLVTQLLGTGRGPGVGRSQAQGFGPSANDSSLIQLPKRCKQMLPPDGSEPVCCMFGYVIIDGRAVDGARVIVKSSHGTVVVWTERVDTDAPYYRLSLTDAPLSVQPGEQLTITAEYSGHRYTLVHTAREGGQQVDLVLPRNQADDYVFDRRIWTPSASGMLRAPLGVATDKLGNIYVADTKNDRIQVFNKSGQLLAGWGQLGSQNGRFVKPSRIAINGSNELYVVDSGNNQVHKFSLNGSVLNVFDNVNNSEFCYCTSDIAIGKSNVVYTVSDGEIKKFDGNSVLIKKWAAHDNVTGADYVVERLGIDLNDNVYVFGNDYAGVRPQRVLKFDANGNYISGWDLNGEIYTDIAIGHDGSVYLANYTSGHINKYTNSGSYMGRIGYHGDDSQSFVYPIDIQVGFDGGVLVVDEYTNSVQKFSSSMDWVMDIGTPYVPESLYYPYDIDVDDSGNIYVADTQSNYHLLWWKFSYLSKSRFQGFIWKISSDGLKMDKLGVDSLYYPKGVAVSKDGSIYASDAVDGESNFVYGEVVNLSPSGVFVKKSATEKYYAGSIAVDGSGNIYGVNADQDNIWMFDADLQKKGVFGGSGSENGKFNVPSDVYIDKYGNVYVSDLGNHRIQVFNQSGVFLRAWGGYGSGKGQFSGGNQGVFVGKNDKVYTVDSGSGCSRFQRFSLSGTWETGWNICSDFNQRNFTSIAVNSVGEVIAADRDLGLIEIFRPMSYTKPIATIVTTGLQSVVAGQPVEMLGMGATSMPATTITGYEWTVDGSSTPFATTPAAQLNTSGLAPGSHMVSFRVKDSRGEVSDSQSFTVEVSSPPTPNPRETWTFLLYLAADGGSLDGYLGNTGAGVLARLMRSGLNPNVQVAVLFDGSLQGGGDSFRYLFSTDGQVARQEALGEVNMGNPQTLVDFVRWGKQQAPADHYYLAIADHANALDGIAIDKTSGSQELLDNAELRQALMEITESGARPIDLLHLDGCLMGLLEIAYQVRGLTSYLVVSENVAWSVFAYEDYRRGVDAHTKPRELAQFVAQRYAAQVAAYYPSEQNTRLPYTIAALDMSLLDGVVLATDDLAIELKRYALQDPRNPGKLTGLRTQAQKLDSDVDSTLEDADEYVDLAHWASIVEQQVDDAQVRERAQTLRSRLPGLVIKEFHSSGVMRNPNQVLVNVDLSQAHGLGIYFPPQPNVQSFATYAQWHLQFPKATNWDEFLLTWLTTLPLDSHPRPINPAAPLPLDGLVRRVFVPTVGRP